MVTASDKYQSPDYENHCYFSQNFKKKKRKADKSKKDCSYKYLLCV